MGFWRVFVGNIFLRSAAVLWHDARRGGAVFKVWKRARESGQLSDASVRSYENVLGAETERSAKFQVHLPNFARNSK